MLLIENGSKIYAADTLSGPFVLAALLPGRLEALAAAPDGRLYGFDDGLLVTVDLAAERTVPVARSSDRVAQSIDALAIDEQGRAFAAVTGVESGIYRVDLATADFTLIPGTEPLFASALTMLDGVLYAASARELIALDPESGAILSTRDLLVSDAVGALTGSDGRLYAFTLDKVVELDLDTGQGTTIVEDVSELVVNDRVLRFVAGDATPVPGETGMGLSGAEVREVALLYEAGLDRDGNIDKAGLNFWIDQREAGLSMTDMAFFFLESAEFVDKFGPVEALSGEDYIDLLYDNVLDREGDAAGIAFWNEIAARPGVDRAQILLSFAVSVENGEGSQFLTGLTEITPGLWDFV